MTNTTMGLVDYSESESSGSESEASKKPPQRTAQGSSSKKAFQKVVDRSNPGKIVVNLPLAQAATESTTDEPPAKKSRTAGASRFSGFNSFLPAPKNASKRLSTAAASGRQGIGFKTSAAPGFNREVDDDDGINGKSEESTLGLVPEPSKKNEPAIPEGQKSADEVKLVGKPLMFRPLSVARDPRKKNKAKAAKLESAQQMAALSSGDKVASAPSVPKKVSLFSLPTDEEAETETETAPTNGIYEPLFEGRQEVHPVDSYADYDATYATAPAETQSLDIIADDLNLSAAARRDLFGRGGNQHEAKKVVNFNMDKEYNHNEEVRAMGDQQSHNPLRTIQGGGKHSLKQLVQNVQSQRDAYEDTFARNKTNRKAAASRYGW